MSTCAGRTAAATEQLDTVTVNATNGDDVFGVTGDVGGVSGLRAAGRRPTCSTWTRGRDRLTLNALGGDDVIDAISLEVGG